MLLWSGVGGQLLPSCCASQGWWSAIVIGGQLLSSCCCGQGLVASYCHHVAVVKGWWSAISIMLLWSGGPLVIIMLLWPVLGGQLRTGCIERPFCPYHGWMILIAGHQPLTTAT